MLTDLNRDQRRDYEALVTALTARFEPSNTAEIYRAQLKGRVRGKVESLTELSQSIRHLTRKAYPKVDDQVREHLSLERFIESLNDSEMEWFVFQAKPASMEKAVETALEYEAFKQGRRRRMGEKQFVRTLEESGNPACLYHGDAGSSPSQGAYSTEASFSSYAFECEGYAVPCSNDMHQHADTDGRVAQMTSQPHQCFQCNATGHFIRDCPARPPCVICGKMGHWKGNCPMQLTAGHAQGASGTVAGNTSQKN